MDVNTLMKLVLSPASTQAISNSTGLPADKITAVLNNVMPMLLDGASAQAANNAVNFDQAIDAHADADTRDLGKFLGGVDLADGAKIVSHLLGAKTADSAEATAKGAGVNSADVKKIMAIVAPLLLTILGQQKKKHGLGSALLSAVVSGAVKKTDFGSMLGLLGKIMK